MNDNIVVAFILFELVVELYIYLLVSKKENNYINILTPTYIVRIPAIYVLPIFYVLEFGQNGSTVGYIFVYTCLLAESLAFALVYVYWRGFYLKLPFSEARHNIIALSLISIAIAYFLYIPVMLAFPGDLLHPRLIYTQTRTGYGVYVYLSSLFAYIAIVLSMYIRQRVLKTILVFAVLIVLYIHGSKGQVMGAFFIIILYWIYVKNMRASFFEALTIGGGIVLILFTLFSLTMSLGPGVGGIMRTLSAYSDFTRNAVLDVDSGMSPLWGRLTLENNTLSLVPRVIDPGKPRDYGSLFLSKIFFPERFEKNTGAPAFGVGVQYADFGVFALLYLAFFGAMRGALSNIFVRRLRKTKHPSDLIVVAFLSGVSFIPTGLGWYFPEILLISLCVGVVVSAVVRHRERSEEA